MLLFDLRDLERLARRRPCSSRRRRRPRPRRSRRCPSESRCRSSEKLPTESSGAGRVDLDVEAVDEPAVDVVASPTAQVAPDVDARTSASCSAIAVIVHFGRPAPVVFLTTWPSCGSLLPSVKLASCPRAWAEAARLAVPRSGVMSLVFGVSKTPNVTSKSTSSTSASRPPDQPASARRGSSCCGAGRRCRVDRDAGRVECRVGLEAERERLRRRVVAEVERGRRRGRPQRRAREELLRRCPDGGSPTSPGRPTPRSRWPRSCRGAVIVKVASSARVLPSRRAFVPFVRHGRVTPAGTDQATVLGVDGRPASAPRQKTASRP